MFKKNNQRPPFGGAKKSFAKRPFNKGGSSRFSQSARPATGPNRTGQSSVKRYGLSATRPNGRPSGRFGGGRGNSGSRNSRPARGNKFRGDYIDENRFINKAVKKDVEIYVPKHNFMDFELNEKIVKNLANKGYLTPSPIQDQAIPEIMSGKDVIGVASTGTGKTAAFLLPLIDKLTKKMSSKVMVLAPTRELAQQIENELRTFTQGMGIYSVTCVGGSPINKQIRELSRGVHFIIGTPGRVKDLIMRKRIDMNTFYNIVLDEADRMLDMGFIPDMRFILGQMPNTKQALFFSATLSPEIRKLCDDFLHSPVTVAIKSRETAEGIEQNIVRARTKEEKIEALHEILLKPEANKVLIFREMKRHTDDLMDELNKRGFKTLALHGDMRNSARVRAVNDLASGKIHALIATDVAARGIDIPDITHVINYDIPQNYETYIHRIGRTGRAGKAGIALTFV